MCPLLANLKLSGWSSLKVLRYFNVKNVFYGEFNGTRVVVKKLAHDSELQELDQKLCQRSAFERTNCKVSQAMRTFLAGNDTTTALLDFMYSVRTEQDITTCPTRRLITHVMNAVETNVLTVARREDGLRVPDVIAYTASVNPEPLVLQSFQHSDDWPFPEFLGSCGRVVLVKDCGDPLSQFESAEWLVRVGLALQLLDIAQLLTANPTDFALYLTDVSLDNFAVDAAGRVKVVDAENVIIVDRRQIVEDRKLGWEVPSQHLVDMCKDCLSFSSEDLCSHYLADHNHFAICSGILAPRAFYSSQGGLLHSIPEEAERKYSLSAILTACDQPFGRNQTRFDAAYKLRQALRLILEEHSIPVRPSRIQSETGRKSLQ